MMRRKRRRILAAWLLVAVVTTAAGIGGSAQESLITQLTIDRAIELGLEHNSQVKQAELSLQIAQLELEATKARSYLPTISLNITPPSLSTTGSTEEIKGTLGASFSFPWGVSSDLAARVDLDWNWKLGELSVPSWDITLAQKLDLGQLNNGVKELQDKERAVVNAQLSWEQAKDDVVLDVVQHFGNLLIEKMRMEQAQAALEDAQEELAEVKTQVETGLKGESALLDAQLKLLEAQIELEESTAEYAADKDEFQRVLLGTDQEYDLVSLDLPFEELLQAADDLLAQEQIPTAAIANAPGVRTAQEAVEDAEENLHTAQRDALPEVSLEAKVSESGWGIGLTIAFDLFAPDRWLNIDIAQACLQLAQEQLSAAQEQVKNTVLNQKAALRQAVQDVKRLEVEEEKWNLEETINQDKLDAGLISSKDWDDFQAEKTAFYSSVEQRKIDLIVAYLRYRNSLDLELNWEEWLG